MVHIAIAGATADIAQEVLDELVAASKHKILLLSRQDPPKDESRPGVRSAKTDYQSTGELVKLLKGVDTVLSFIDPMADPDNQSQIHLIDACVKAGVRRFAPSEWSLLDVERFPVYAPKAEVRKYLETLNKDKKVLEYCIFAQGFNANYYSFPHSSAKHLHQLEVNFDFDNRRAILLEGGENDRLTLTTIQDVAKVAARAVEYEGEWPVIGGMKGSELSVGELLALGEKIRGAPFKVDYLKSADIQKGEVKASWFPEVGHHTIPKEQMKEMGPKLIAGILTATEVGALNVSDDWNRLLPDFKFTSAEEFLTEVWKGKP